jgi:hypothetical protein
MADNIRDVTALGTLCGWQAAEKAGEPAALGVDVRERVDRVPRYRPPPCWTLCWPACRATCSQCAHLQVLRGLSQDRSPAA